MLKVAIFLGAGASVPDGAPTDLLNAYLNPREELNLCQARQQRIYKLLHELFPLQSNHRSVYPQFEEVLTVVELALQRKETFRGYGGSQSGNNEMSLHDAHKDLVLSIAELLAKSLHRRYETKHDKLVRSLSTGDNLSDILFLTTNYDILLDNALTRFFSEPRGELQIPNYGMEHDVEKYENSERHRLDSGTYNVNATFLLKLHGSLNWFYCPRCKSISLTPYTKSGAISAYGPNPCLHCHQHCLPNIIPPTYLKNIREKHLLQVWRRADRELKRVDEIVFCGYSLPPADLQVKYLLKRAQVNRNGRNRLRIFVMNKKSGETEHEWKESNRTTHSQYERFFGSSNVDYLYKGFEDLVDDGLDALS